MEKVLRFIALLDFCGFRPVAAKKLGLQVIEF